MDVRTAGSARPLNRLPTPDSVNFRKIAWIYAVGVIGYHLIALLAFLPWFFSWTGVALAIAGCYVFGTLGINLCYHRLLAHRGFNCPKWLEHCLAILGVCCLQDTPARWVAVHRRHHQYADEQEDSHSPLAGFFWGHMGWLLVENEDLTRLRIYDRYAKDVLSDRFYRSLERNGRWVQIIFLSWFVFFLGGFAAELVLGGTPVQALQFGASLLIWGVFLRTVLVWHITWSVNSVTHLWGYRSYATDEESRNNLFIGIISNGEGWHNNHHADSRSVRHGHRWWELDITYQTVRLFSALGLARNIVTSSPHLAAARLGGRLVTREHRVYPAE